MYTVIVEAVFSATHCVYLSDGTLEQPHSHDWIVRAHFGSAKLNGFGMVVDFEEAQSSLQTVLGQLHNTDLNAHQAFSGTCPTAEVVCRYVFERLSTRQPETLRRIELTEAPGCVAAFEPD